MTEKSGKTYRITRREMLRLTALTGMGLIAAQCVAPPPAPTQAPAPTEAPQAPEATAAPAAGVADKIVWVSPRGTLEVMDDFNLWVAEEMGYFKAMNVELQAEPGPLEALAVTKLVAEKQADIGYPSPGVFMASLDAGMPLVFAWEMKMTQVFDFALPKDSPITSVKELEGKTIALGSEGWSVIVDPMLVEAGIDPKSVTYLNAGNQWGQAVALGQADAGLCWRGLAAQWLAQGLEVKYLVGEDFSKHPANGYVVRKEDLDDAGRVDVLTRFFKATCMAYEFTRANPLAAAQITYAQFPAIREQMTPQLALDSMLELGTGYFEGERIGKGYGYSDLESWQSYIDTVYQLGQIKTQYKAEDVVTNFFIEEANKFDREKARADAAAFELDDEFKGLEIKYEV